MKTKIIALMLTTTFLITLSTALPKAASEDFELTDAYWSTPLTLGGTNELVVKVRCNIAGAENLQAELTLYNVAGSNLVNTSSYPYGIDKGAVITLRFSYDIPDDATQSFYKASLHLSYLVNGSPRTETIDFNVGFQGKPQFDVSSSTSTLARGKTTSVTITVSVQESPARNVEISVSSLSPLVTVIGGNAERQGIIDIGEEIKLLVNVLVDSAAGDTATLTVTINYEDFDRQHYTETLNIGFRVQRGGEPHISASVSPNSVISGSLTTIWITLRNTGSGTARDVHVELSSNDPRLTVVSGTSVSLGDISSGASARFAARLQVDTTASGVASLTLRITFFDQYGDSQLEVINAGLRILKGEKPIIAISSNNLTAPPSKMVKIFLTVTNIGGAQAEDIVLDIVSGQGIFVVNTSRMLIKRLSPKANATVNFDAIFQDVDSAVLNVKARWTDIYGHEYFDTFNLAIQVKAPQKPVLDIETKTKILNPNKVNVIELIIKNTGNAAAYNVSLNLASPSPEIGSLIGTSHRKIPELLPGKNTTITYKVFVQPRVYGALQLPLQISYKDEWDKKYSNLMVLGFEIKGDWEISVVYVETYPYTIFPGDKLVQLKLTLTNSGDYLAKNIDIRFMGSKDGKIRPTSTEGAHVFLPYLPVGNTAKVVFLADFSSELRPGNYDLYLNASGKPVKFTVTVVEKASFNVYNNSPLTFYQGQKGVKLVLTIENAGHVKADNVRIELYSPFISGMTSTYVGTMDADEKRRLVFEIDVDELAPLGNIPIEVKIMWTQEKRETYQTLKIHALIKQPRLPLLAYIAIIVFVMSLTVLVLKSHPSAVQLKEKAKQLMSKLRRPKKESS